MATRFDTTSAGNSSLVVVAVLGAAALVSVFDSDDVAESAAVVAVVDAVVVAAVDVSVVDDVVVVSIGVAVLSDAAGAGAATGFFA